ncbi:hypothetical protein [Microbulbifer epialgicus]|uniref:Uncharacterized protein n=1 Tax=Microbulbifer epialgicus TaxID=393907 RepID=A0ABV4NUS1_9GAMM
MAITNTLLKAGVAVFISTLLLPIIAFSKSSKDIDFSPLDRKLFIFPVCNVKNLGKTTSVLLSSDLVQSSYLDELGAIPDGAYTILKCLPILPESNADRQKYSWVITRAGDGLGMTWNWHEGIP